MKNETIKVTFPLIISSCVCLCGLFNTERCCVRTQNPIVHQNMAKADIPEQRQDLGGFLGTDTS